MGGRNTPDGATRFCKNQAVKKFVDGSMVKKKLPNDWCAVTDDYPAMHRVFADLVPTVSQSGEETGLLSRSQAVATLIGNSS